MKVYAVLSPGIITAEPPESRAEPPAGCALTGVGALAEMEEGRLMGIVTERDLVHAIAEGQSSRITPVPAYLIAEPATVEAGDDTAGAALEMLDLGVPHLPVTDRGGVVGMVSARDLLVLTAWPDAAPQVAPAG